MAVSQADIQAWFAANPGATDQQIAQAMQQFGVSQMQVAQATGASLGDVSTRYNKAMGQPYAQSPEPAVAASPPGPNNFTDRDIQGWLQQNAGIGDQGIAQAMQQNRVGLEQMARATGLDVGEVQKRFNAAVQGRPAAAPLSASSTGTATGTAYTDYLNSAGSKDTASTRNDANAHLLNLGMTQADINDAYSSFRENNPELAGEGDLARQASGAGLALRDPSKYNTQNPYLDQMGDSITSQVTDNLQRNIMPGIRSSVVSSGNFGGSRQGVVEANALKDANQGLSNALTGMRFGDYNSTMGRQLQQYGQDQSYNLGLGNLDLNRQNSNNNFYTAQRGQDLQQVQVGANLFGQGNTGMLNQGQGVYNLGLTGQQAPWQSMQNFGNVASPYTGFGSTSQNQSGSAGAGFLGGALAGSQAYNIFSQ